MSASTDARFRRILIGRLLRTLAFILLLCGMVLIESWPTITSAPEVEAAPRREIRAGSAREYPPFAVVRRDGTPDGFTVDLVKAVGEVMGLQVTVTVKPWNDLKADLQRGRLDLLLNLAYSKEADAFVDFAVPHAMTTGGVFVRSRDTRIRSVRDPSR